MADYIERGRLLRDPYFQEDRYPESHLLRMAIMNQPAANVAPVVRGRWDLLDDASSKIVKWNCNKCNHISTRKTNYCPDCGARMETEEK